MLSKKRRNEILRKMIEYNKRNCEQTPRIKKITAKAEKAIRGEIPEYKLRKGDKYLLELEKEKAHFEKYKRKLNKVV